MERRRDARPLDVGGSKRGRSTGESTAIARCWCLKLKRGQGGQALRTEVLVQIESPPKGGVLVAKPLRAARGAITAECPLLQGRRPLTRPDDSARLVLYRLPLSHSTTARRRTRDSKDQCIGYSLVPNSWKSTIQSRCCDFLLQNAKLQHATIKVASRNQEQYHGAGELCPCMASRSSRDAGTIELLSSPCRKSWDMTRPTQCDASLDQRVT